MGNPQHLEWLLEGVDAWNKRRERDDFVPDLSECDVRQAFEDTLQLDDRDRVPLSNVDFKNAEIAGANLAGADLRHADLTGANCIDLDLAESNCRNADLSSCNFSDANLEGVSFGGAILERTIFSRANLENAYIPTLSHSTEMNSPFSSHTRSDLSQSRGLSQKQLNRMDGDTGTILPKTLTHPPHWPDPKVPFEPSGQGDIQDDPLFPNTSPSVGRATRPVIVKRSIAETKKTLLQSYAPPAALSAYMAEQLQNEIAAHAMTAKPNEDIDALNEWNAKHNFLTEMLASVTIIHEHLPVTTKPNVTDDDAKSVRDALEKLGVQVQGTLEWLDANPGTLGSFWKLGCITGASSLMAALGIPIAISAPIATGVIGANTVRVLFKKE